METAIANVDIAVGNIVEEVIIIFKLKFSEVEKLKIRGILDKVNIMISSDHGMTSLSRDHVILVTLF